MKKVMIGLLILIPILILLIVAAVTNFISASAWIAVDDFDILDKNTGNEAESVIVVFPGESTEYSMYDFLEIIVKPDYANRYSIGWRISGAVECMDKEYENKYKKYIEERDAHDKYLSEIGAINEKIRVAYEEIENLKTALDKRIEEIQASDYEYDYQRDEAIIEAKKEYEAQNEKLEQDIAELNDRKDSIKEPEVGREVAPAAMFVDNNGNEAASNTSGKFVVNSYCRFNVIIQIEEISKTVTVIAEGYNVERIELTKVGDDISSLKVGENMMLEPTYTPLSSIVTKTRWHSSDPTVASIDGNGVVTAHKVGSTDITVEANKFDQENEYVTSSVYTVNVVKGVSNFGTQIYTSKTSVNLDKLGIGTPISFDGCTISGNDVTLTADVAHITTSDGTVTITKCGENDIVIENAGIYGAERGYVFAVGGLSLKLQAKWKDNLKEGVPEGVVWAAESEGNIATVTEDGEITATESGLVEIIADCNGNSARIIINMQLKLVSMKLRTSNDYYSVGLALETVFASDRYVNAEIDLRARVTDDKVPDEVINNDKVPNSTLIQIIGAPKRTDGDTDGVYQAKLLAFYSAFTYEIISGNEYAHFDTETPNRLIFDSAGLEGKGKQVVRVKVRAKYPRYASASTLIEEEVDVKVIFGVEVSNITEMRVASHDQYSYAHLDGNLQDRELVFEHTVTEDHAPEIYRVYNSEYSLRTYGISVVNDMAFEDGEVEDKNSLKAFGDIYGNGHRLQAELNQLDGNQAMLWIGWSNVTISNFNLRVNKIDKEGTLSVDDAAGFTGEAFQIFSVAGWELWLQGYGPNKPDEYYGHERNRLFNVRYEYSVIENGRRIGQAYNSDYTLDGLIMRNVTTPALFIPSRMNMYKEESTGEYITYPDYNHTVLNNCVFTNCLATVGSFAQEGYTVLASGGYGWNNDYHGQDGTEHGDGRFVRKDPTKNAEYFKEHFVSKGINAEFHQTGFIDIYNWQNVQSAQLISINANNESGQLISSILLPISGKLIAANAEFERIRYIDEAKNTTYVHMGFIFTGMDFGSGILNEPLYIVSTFEDTRFAKTIKSADIVETQGADSVVRIAEKFIHSLSVECVCYSSDATKNDIMPNSTFDIDENFIKRLHQNA